MSSPKITFAELKKVFGLEGPKDITAEARRTYVQPDGTIYTIESPVALYYRHGGSTHRVVDANGEVHAVPVASSTVVRWTPRDVRQPIQF